MTALSFRQSGTVFAMTREQTAQVRIAVFADDDTLLLFGKAVEMPTSGTFVVEGRRRQVGSLRALCWRKQPFDGGKADRFLAILRCAGIARLRPRWITVERHDGAPAIDLSDIGRIEAEPMRLVSMLKSEMADSLPMVFDFLRKDLGGEGTGAQSPGALRILLAMLRATAEPVGFVELLGRTKSAGLLVQGWTRHLPPGGRNFIVEAGDLTVQAGFVGAFDRSDAPRDATGVLVTLPTAESVAPSEIRRVYFAARRTWHYLELLDGRTVLAEAEAQRHLKDMLSRLRTDQAILRMLKRFSRGLYEGAETVSNLELPVRAAVELAVLAPGRGIYVAGWLLDPAGHVGAVTLKGDGGLAVALHERWSRINRRDVSDRFADDPLFAACLPPGDHVHGFVAHAGWHGHDRIDERLHLELSLSDGSCAYLPVKATTAAAPAIVRRLLGGGTIRREDFSMVRNPGAVQGLLEAPSFP